ncbi:Hypothetical protein Eab7_2844 [Exiguobacterium antarcticum B7]|nr:Hypothetical protein Eab7_2844 [Exiguobacterium antarcticum B7]
MSSGAFRWIHTYKKTDGLLRITEKRTSNSHVFKKEFASPCLKKLNYL